MLKKSQVLKEGYEKGLKDALNAIKSMLCETDEGLLYPDNIDEKTLRRLITVNGLSEESADELRDAYLEKHESTLQETFGEIGPVDLGELQDLAAEAGLESLENFLYAQFLPQLTETGKTILKNEAPEENTNYSYKEIRDFQAIADTNWDSVEIMSEGSLTDGEYIIYIAGIDKWMVVTEKYLNEWSSAQRVEYYDEYDQIPKEYRDAAEEYNGQFD